MGLSGRSGKRLTEAPNSVIARKYRPYTGPDQNLGIYRPFITSEVLYQLSYVGKYWVF